MAFVAVILFSVFQLGAFFIIHTRFNDQSYAKIERISERLKESGLPSEQSNQITWALLDLHTTTSSHFMGVFMVIVLLNFPLMSWVARLTLLNYKKDD